MLTVDDDDFWRDMQPLDIAGLPAMQVGRKATRAGVTCEGLPWPLRGCAGVLADARLRKQPLSGPPDAAIP